MTIKHLQSKGFSMVEALVAITVLLIGVVGPITLLANSITNANYAKNQITAFFLAQEGQEAVINARNNNRLAGKTSGIPDGSNNDDDGPSNFWLAGNGLKKCIEGNAYDICQIDTSISTGDSKLTGCNNNVCPPLVIKNNGFYGYSDGTPSIFTRTIEVDPVNEGGVVNMAKVIVTVTWQEIALRRLDNNNERSFILESIIFR